MPDLITANFGLLETLLFLEIVVLAAAALFYQIAKLVSRGNRRDPILRFYYVFWQSFFARVTPIGVLDARQAESMARAAGHRMVGEADSATLAQLDAPDLGAIGADDLRGVVRELPAEMDELPNAAVAEKESRTSATSPSPVPPPADALLDVRIIPRSPTNRVAGVRGRTLVLQVTFEAEDGQANGAVTTLLSDWLKLPPYRIVLLRGQYRADKAFKILNLTPAALATRLAALPAAA